MTETATLERPETQTRCRIVETAERFFRTIGYQKTTVADIARSLKMSPANIYRFFDSKRAINEAVAERLFDEQETAIGAIAAQPGPAADRLRAIIAVCHQMNRDRLTSDLKMHEMVEVAMDESWDVIRGHIERVNRIFLQVVQDGQASGEFRSGDPVVLAFCAKTAMMRFFHPQLIVQCAGEPGPTLDELTDFILRGLRAP